MKSRFYSAIFAILLLSASTASAIVHSGITTSPQEEVCFKNFGMSQPLTVANFVSLSTHQLEQQTGKTVNLKQKIAFKLTQWKLKKWLDKHPTGVANPNEKDQLGSFQFNTGAFFLGLLLGLIGVIISAIFQERNAWHSALIGFGVWVLIVLVAALARG